MKTNQKHDNFTCDNCLEEEDTLYEGWYRTAAYTNPYAKGTATSSVIQHRRLCIRCLKLFISNNMCCAIPPNFIKS